jgi:hypothetical protein
MSSSSFGREPIDLEGTDRVDTSAAFGWVRQLHTLGPTGTNCERAAFAWMRRKCPAAALCLHFSLEKAAGAVASQSDAVLLGAVAYPQLHSLIYSHLDHFQIIDVFIVDTHEMILASRTGSMPLICATHPSPEKLLPSTVARKYVSSNALAAEECARGMTDGCLTTLCAAQQYELKPVHSFGRVRMAFTIHGPPDHGPPEGQQLFSADES